MKKKSVLTGIIGGLALTANVCLMSHQSAAQANHWVFLPDLKMNASSGVFSKFSSGSGITSCLSSTKYQQKTGALSNSSGSYFYAYAFCGLYNTSGNLLSSMGTKGQDNLFTIPGLCHEVWSVKWIDVSGPPSMKALKIYKYKGDGSSSLEYIGETDITPSGAVPDCGGVSVAVTALSNSGSRAIYAVSGKSLYRWVISPDNGLIVSTGSIATLPYGVNDNVSMEVSADGEYVMINSCTVQGVMVYHISSGAVTTINVGKTISGFEYAKINGIPRLYISSHQSTPPSGGIEYYDLSTFAGPYTVFTYPTQLVFGYTEIERAKNGLLYFAYNPTYGSGYVSGAGELYSFDPNADNTVAPKQVLNSSKPVKVNTYWKRGYYIQNQIDGENYNKVDYSVPKPFISFRPSHELHNVSEPPMDVFLCNDMLEMFTYIPGYHTSYTVTVETGTSNYVIGPNPGTDYWAFTPASSQPTPNPVTIPDASERDTVDLASYFGWLKAYLGNIRVTITVTNCGQTASYATVINIKNPLNFRLTTTAGSCGQPSGTNDLHKTLPIADQAFSGPPCAAGWTGATFCGVNNLAFTGYGTVTNVTQMVEEVDPNTGTAIATIGTISSSSIPNSNTYFNQTNFCNGYFNDNYPSVALGGRTFKYTLIMTSMSSFGVCINRDSTYFKIATDATASPNAQWWRTAEPEEGGSETKAPVLSPNPAEDIIRIGFADLSDDAVFVVSDNTGRTVLSAGNLLSAQGKVEIKNLPSGMYYYRFSNGAKMYHGKFVKK